jgi:hypothetical protein
MRKPGSTRGFTERTERRLSAGFAHGVARGLIDARSRLKIAAPGIRGATRR